MDKFRIAYIVNEYPKVSHTFIRREIFALERQGFDILRISVRGWDAELVDEEDRQERKRTRYILKKGISSLLWSMLRTFLTHPWRFVSALVLATTVLAGRRADRPLAYHLAYFSEACHILPWLKTFGATHVHAHFANNSAEVALLAHALGGPPFSFTFHGEQESLLSGIDEKIRHALFVVAITSYARSQLFHRIENSSWPKIKIVHCGLELAFHSVESLPPSTLPRFVCVSRLSKKKGQLLLVEAAYQLAQKGINFELVLAGDGEMRAEVEESIKRLGLTRQIRITGWISSSQVREEILAARALVLPSFDEGLPVVIMEAMALRRPILATYVSGIPELVTTGEHGWLFPAGSIDDLATAMQDCLLKSPEELQKMGNAGYLRVMQRHSIDTEAVKLAEYFRAGAELNAHARK